MTSRGRFKASTEYKVNAPEFKPSRAFHMNDLQSKLNNINLFPDDEDFKRAHSYYTSNTPLTPYDSYPITPPSSFTPPPSAAAETPQTVSENPIGDLKELCDFIRTPYVKHFEEEGQSHSKKYKCVLTFCGKIFESDWVTNQKEAEKTAALRLLYYLPVRRVDDTCIVQRGSSHEMHFQAVVASRDGTGKIIISKSKTNKTQT